jgi:dihydroorotase
MDVKRYDLLIKNGRLFDPAKNIDMVGDIGVIYPNIADVFDPSTMVSRVCAKEVIDAKGLYVVPGLIEMHSHILPGLDFYLTVEELYKYGVVATCDMGSASHSIFSNYRQEIMDKAPMVTNAALNLSSTAWVQHDISEYVSRGLINKDKLIRMIEIHKDVVIGVKSAIQLDNKEDAAFVLQSGREVCRATDTRMIVHVTGSPLELPDYIKYFDKGDIVTHTFHGVGNGLLNKEGKVWPEAWEAKKRGVIFDACRGTRHWNVDVARAAFAQGFFPDLITADTTALSDKPLTCQLPTIMSEIMALGMSFKEVILKTTDVPSKIMKGVKSGLERGLPANITLIDLQKSDFTYSDAHGNKLKGEYKVVPVATIIKGKVKYWAL